MRASTPMVCTLSLCRMPDDRKAVAEMKRVLRPGGRPMLLDHVASGRCPDEVLASIRSSVICCVLVPQGVVTVKCFPRGRSCHCRRRAMLYDVSPCCYDSLKNGDCHAMIA
ncbi:MAG: hypothetical protein HY287_17200 [Planctomycetes bacterium]|nr:hypothetical protein [Planctomycetota bacterium]MBI3836064.1 hypothetical protein [Planctomycetota bacterium]